MGVVGLDYGEVRRMAHDLGINLSGGMWSKIRALERLGLERLNAGRKDQHSIPKKSA